MKHQAMDSFDVLFIYFQISDLRGSMEVIEADHERLLNELNEANNKLSKFVEIAVLQSVFDIFLLAASVGSS